MSALLTVVTGPPCSGKSTWVLEHRGPSSVVVDLDAIAHSLGYPEDHVEWGDRHPAAEVARGIRFQLVRQALAGDIAADVLVIDTAPTDRMTKAYDHAGAEWVRLDPGRDVCLARAAGRSAATADEIRRWYAEQGVQQVGTALDVFG